MEAEREQRLAKQIDRLRKLFVHRSQKNST